jgi:hypothetical protein
MGFGAQAVLVVSAILMISPNVPMTLTGAALALPVFVLNWRRSQRNAPS